MLQRSLTALVGIPIVVGAIIFGGPFLTALVLVAGVVGIREFYRMTPPSVSVLPLVLGAAWVVALIVGAQAASSTENFLLISGVIMAAGSFVSLLWFIIFYRAGAEARKKDYLISFLYLILGPVYIGFLLSHALMIGEIYEYEFDDFLVSAGTEWLLFAILTTFAVDTGAYLVGRTIGRHKMAPSISPNKTWEGSVGGFVAAVVAAVVLGDLFDLRVTTAGLAVTGAVVGVVGQLGDLLESKLKRIADVKDSGSIIPGHGGLLDRLDSLLFTLPAVFYLIILVSTAYTVDAG